MNDGLTSEPFASVRVLVVVFSVSGLKSSTGRCGRVPLWQVPSWRMVSVGGGLVFRLSGLYGQLPLWRVPSWLTTAVMAWGWPSWLYTV